MLFSQHEVNPVTSANNQYSTNNNNTGRKQDQYNSVKGPLTSCVKITRVRENSSAHENSVRHIMCKQSLQRHSSSGCRNSGKGEPRNMEHNLLCSMAVFVKTIFTSITKYYNLSD